MARRTTLRQSVQECQLLVLTEDQAMKLVRVFDDICLAEGVPGWRIDHLLNDSAEASERPCELHETQAWRFGQFVSLLPLAHNLAGVKRPVAPPRVRVRV